MPQHETRNDGATDPVEHGMIVDLYTSAFCVPCHRARAVLDEAAALVPAAIVTDRDVALRADEAEVAGIRMTPTTIIRTDAGAEVFRAEGVPTLNQLLTAMARAV